VSTDGERKLTDVAKDRKMNNGERKQREIASKGGRAAHQKGTAHEWTSDEARNAGRKGGQISRGGRGRLADTPADGTGQVPAEAIGE
jgi:general stress protein YciG